VILASAEVAEKMMAFRANPLASQDGIAVRKLDKGLGGATAVERPFRDCLMIGTIYNL